MSRYNMTPKEVQALLSAACPELTWEIDGKFVVAKEVASFVRIFWGPTPPQYKWPDAHATLRIVRHDGNLCSIYPGDVPAPVTPIVAIGICDVLHADVLRNAGADEHVEARRLCLRVRIQNLRELLQGPPVCKEWRAQDVATLSELEAEAARLGAAT